MTYSLYFIVVCLSLADYSSAADQCPALPRGNFRWENEFINESALSTPEECARQCVDGETPKICYYNFHVELYGVMGPACDLCTPTATNQIVQDCECVTGDGVERMFTAVNRMLPGPSIQVCQGDKVVIDVFNNLEGQETTIHWHGILQEGSQYYDGVPYVTQCPIHQGNWFRYQWIARDAGTQFYHSHTGLQKMNGFSGSIIVRQPPSEDLSLPYYDYDLTTNIVFITDTFHMLSEEKFPGKYRSDAGQTPANVLINGKGRYTDTTSNETTTSPLAEYDLKPGYKYRFRLINAQCSNCYSQFRVQGHNLTIIEVDGDPVDPTVVETITSFAGERYDFVLTTDQEPKTYWIQVKLNGTCATSKIQQLGIIRYNGSDNSTASTPPTYDDPLPAGVVLNPPDGICNETRDDAICISQLNISSLLAGVDMEVLTTQKPHHKMYLSFGFNQYTLAQEFTPANPKHLYMIAAAGGSPTAAQINNITYATAPSPLISQYADIPPQQICDENHKPNCTDNCTCTHVIRVKRHSIVEMLVLDQVAIPGLAHPFHLHGTSFHVVGLGQPSTLNVTKITHQCLIDNDEAGNLKRSVKRSPYKDVIAIPTGGYAILRFRANNPGFWFMHCHFLYHTAVGMDYVLWVGEFEDLPPIPKNFPKCGNYKTPITGNLNSVY